MQSCQNQNIFLLSIIEKSHSSIWSTDLLEMQCFNVWRLPTHTSLQGVTMGWYTVLIFCINHLLNIEHAMHLDNVVFQY